jgi:hypothetical protein
MAVALPLFHYWRFRDADTGERGSSPADARSAG